MMRTRSLRRMARALLDAPGGVSEDTARELLAGLTRSDLKALLSALRGENARRSVRVSVAAPADRPAAEDLASLYEGRTLEVSTDPSLGSGILVSAGDNVLDASVMGMIRAAADGMRR